MENEGFKSFVKKIDFRQGWYYLACQQSRKGNKIYCCKLQIKPILHVVTGYLSAARISDFNVDSGFPEGRVVP